MRRALTITVAAAMLLAFCTGCVITLNERGHHHPDRCYDCHNAWELDRVTIGVQCIEFEIIIVDGGYWYRPRGADETPKKFHLLKAGGRQSVLGPDASSAGRKEDDS